MGLKIISGITLTGLLALAFQAGRLENRITTLEMNRIAIERVTSVLVEQNTTIVRLEVTIDSIKNVLREVKVALKEHEDESRARRKY